MASNSVSELSESSIVPRKGKAISNEIRKRLIDADEAGISYKQMSLLFGVKADTAYRICSLRKYQIKPRGGSKGKKLNGEHIQFLLDKIERRPDLTLSEMKDMLFANGGIQISITSLARYLEGNLITLKKLDQIPINRNCNHVKVARKEYASWFLSQHEAGATFCYVDECGFGLYTARTRGRAVKGLPAKKISSNQRTPRITLLCAITPNAGVIHHVVIVGGAKQCDFDQFISELFTHNFGQPLVHHAGFDKKYIILDNAPCHRGVETRLGQYIPSNCELVRLSPYSCELNPIEFTFNSLKAHIKRALSEVGPNIPVEEGMTFVGARRQLLLSICPGAIQSITPISTLNSFYHVLTVSGPKAIRLEDL